MYCVDSSTISIDNSAEYISRNRMIKSCMQDVEYDLTDIEYGYNALYQLQVSVNDIIQTINEIPQFPKPAVNVGIGKIETSIKTLEKSVLLALSKMAIYIAIEEEKIENINNPNRKDYLGQLDDLLNKYLLNGKIDEDIEKYLGTVTKYGGFWLLNSLLSMTKSGFPSAIGYLISHLADARFDNGDYAVGDTFLLLLKPGTSLLTKCCVGSSLVGLYSLCKEYFNDEGIWTPEDTERAALNAMKHLAEYATWTYVATMTTAEIAAVGGTMTVVAGPIGTLAAIGGVITLDLFLTPMVDIAMGEDIIYTFDYHGKDFSIPRNGRGKITYDVILERLYGGDMNSSITGRKLEDNYRNWRDIFGGSDYHDKDSASKMDKYLDRLTHAKDRDEAKNIVEEFYEDLYRDPDFSMLYERIKFDGEDKYYIEGYCNYLGFGEKKDFITESIYQDCRRTYGLNGYAYNMHESTSKMNNYFDRIRNANNYDEVKGILGEFYSDLKKDATFNYVYDNMVVQSGNEYLIESFCESIGLGDKWQILKDIEKYRTPTKSGSLGGGGGR